MCRCGVLDALTSMLACWRIASLLVNEDGPWSVFSRLRYKAGIRSVVRQDAQGRPAVSRTANNALAEGLTCVWCVSLWIAILDFVLQRIPAVRVLWGMVRSVSAISAGAILVHTAVGRDSGRTD